MSPIAVSLIHPSEKEQQQEAIIIDTTMWSDSQEEDWQSQCSSHSSDWEDLDEGTTAAGSPVSKVPPLSIDIPSVTKKKEVDVNHKEEEVVEEEVEEEDQHSPCCSYDNDQQAVTTPTKNIMMSRSLGAYLERSSALYQTPEATSLNVPPATISTAPSTDSTSAMPSFPSITLTEATSGTATTNTNIKSVLFMEETSDDPEDSSEQKGPPTPTSNILLHLRNSMNEQTKRLASRKADLAAYRSSVASMLGDSMTKADASSNSTSNVQQMDSNTEHLLQQAIQRMEENLLQAIQATRIGEQQSTRSSATTWTTNRWIFEGLLLSVLVWNLLRVSSRTSLVVLILFMHLQVRWLR